MGGIKSRQVGILLLYGLLLIFLLIPSVTTAVTGTSAAESTDGTDNRPDNPTGLSGAVVTSPVSAKAWWNNSWSRRAEVTIAEKSGTSLADYQVRIPVTFDADMLSDFADIRFIDNATELPYWRESYVAGSSAIFWVKIPAIPSLAVREIDMYYGNMDAATTSNIHNTFIWGDDFENPAWTRNNTHQVNFANAIQSLGER